ncbi:MAG: diguanylate cyclase [Phycisphaerales bacterium]|nr:diguanylate cyclase [Phycisphaerales bacterium]
MASGEAHPDVRVVLLGRTGLDAALRLDPGIELVRVKTPLEAIGEVANPIDDASPGRAVVVVGSKVKELDDQPGGAADFVSSLRIAHPGVVVLGVQNGSVLPPAYDAGLNPGVSPEMLRRAMRWSPGAADQPEGLSPLREGPLKLGTIAAKAQAGVQATVPRSPDAAPSPTAPTMPSAPASPARGSATDPESLILASMGVGTEGSDAARSVAAKVSSGAEPGDLALVASLVKGGDPLPLALALIRARTGDHSVELLGPADGGARDARCVPVVWESANFGDLRASRVTPEALGVHARWLAGWLRLRDQQNQLRTAAFTDPLTGAWNRRYFDRFISTAVEQARASRTYLTVLLFDIDNFKKYNDLYGHDAGDEILREAVRLLRSVIRPTDRVCRVGGDEFAVIFHEPQGPRQTGSSHPTDVLAIAGRFQQQILNHRFPKLLNCAPGTLTISGGLATFPWDGATPAELLAKADQLAMQSKRQGKNAITIGPGAMRLMEP